MQALIATSAWKSCCVQNGYEKYHIIIEPYQAAYRRRLVTILHAGDLKQRTNGAKHYVRSLSFAINRNHDAFPWPLRQQTDTLTFVHTSSKHNYQRGVLASDVTAQGASNHRAGDSTFRCMSAGCVKWMRKTMC